MKIVVLISANAEWRSIKKIFPDIEILSTKMGEWFEPNCFSQPVVFFHGGWGKISASATTQYVIDHFGPELIFNLGTCGGFEGLIAPGTVVLVEKTIVYDIIEQMTDPVEAIDYYSTDIDLSWLPETLPYTVSRGLLVSGDRDIVVDDIPQLVKHYRAVAADWESGSIAWVAKRNQVRCLILRGVSDVVGTKGGEAYGNFGLYEQRTDEIMKELISGLDPWIQLARN